MNELDNLINQTIKSKNPIDDIVDKIREKHIKSIKGYKYLSDITKLEIGNHIKHISFNTEKVSPDCRVSDIIYKKTRKSNIIKKIELKFVIRCEHAMCKAANYKPLRKGKCPNIKYFKYYINPSKYYIFVSPSPNNKKAGMFDEIVQEYLKNKQTE